MRSLTWEQVQRRRLLRNFLDTPGSRSSVIDVVGAVCGVQAQILTAAELSIASRVREIRQRDVRADLWERHRLVKTYGPRGTLHLLPAHELPMWMAALRRRQELIGIPWYKASGPPPDAPGLPKQLSAAGPLKPAEAEALLGAIGEALDGRCLTREELAEAVTKRLGSWAGLRLRSSWATPPIMQAAVTGHLCFGPNKGAQITFARADQWIGGWKEVDQQEALLEVFRRYLAAYGPATHQDFAAWFNLKPQHVRSVLQTLRSELEEVDVEGWRAWLLEGEGNVSRASVRSSLRLLPQYDCYVLGVRQRDQIIPEAVRARLKKHPRGYEGPAGLSWMLVDGVAVGLWERRHHGKQLIIRVEPFRSLGRAERAQLKAEVGRIGQFLETPAVLRWV